MTWPEERLALAADPLHHVVMENGEATQLILEALFDIRTDVRRLIQLIEENEDDDAGEEEEG